MHWVSIASAALEEQYARLAGAARRPATEAIVTIASPPLEQMRDRRAGHQERAGDVDAETLLEGLRIERRRA